MSRSFSGANIGAADLPGTPAFSQNQRSTVLQPFAVAEAEVLVADALAAGEQRISELQRLEVEVAVQSLEPFGRVARAVLELQHLQISLGLIFVERGFEDSRPPPAGAVPLPPMRRILSRSSTSRA